MAMARIDHALLREIVSRLEMCIFFLTSDLRHHQADGILRGLAAVNDAGNLAAAQNENAVAQFQQNVQILTDVNDGDTLHFLLGQQDLDDVGCVDVQTARRRPS